MPETSNTEEQKNAADSGAQEASKPNTVKTENTSGTNNANNSESNRNESPKSAELRKKRDDLNESVKKLISESKQSYSGLEKLRNDLREKKAQRDAENKIIQGYKAKRDAVNERLKKERDALNKIREELNQIKRASLENPKNIEKEIKRLEWDVQTKHLNAKAEDALWGKINALRRELKSMDTYTNKKDELKNSRKAVRIIEKEARDIHKLVMEHSEKSEIYHRELLAIFEDIKKMDDILPELTKSIMEAKSAADEAHNEYLDAKGISRKHRDTYDAATRKELKEKSDELLAEFKKGKKLSLEDIMAIQAGEK
ncbi:MAG: hypothetical protein ABIF85_04435 [Nanoarchaeota archaeon]|nr:hypothetical protein [Nanoarchaeota archaeon]MBU4451172.1 hypothetical protein [Nanoarchaeota archaeon]MCG2724315.1 hypothetical protein [archaeon]